MCSIGSTRRKPFLAGTLIRGSTWLLRRLCEGLTEMPSISMYSCSRTRTWVCMQSISCSLVTARQDRMTVHMRVSSHRRAWNIIDVISCVRACHILQFSSSERPSSNEQGGSPASSWTAWSKSARSHVSGQDWKASYMATALMPMVGGSAMSTSFHMTSLYSSNVMSCLSLVCRLNQRSQRSGRPAPLSRAEASSYRTMPSSSGSESSICSNLE
mmetsp:Transcript_53413/g.137830  ORF Transcript_53413/g.137830 Transcript_53413/m.137830 type:complete len:214 (-) Transcript_53413:50-691(-)